MTAALRRPKTEAVLPAAFGLSHYAPGWNDRGDRFGVSQLCRNPVFQSLGNKVLQPFSLFVHFIPWEIEHVMKKAFQQPVVTQHFQCAMFPSLGQTAP